MVLTLNEKKLLLEIAKKTIHAVVKNEIIPEPPEVNGNLSLKYGVFVTIHKEDQLRGCIGYIMGVEPLITAVVKMAKSASTEDPRFPSITIEELDKIEIEISVLSPLEKVDKIEDITVGKDGLLMKRNFYQGLLLPQVATENNWTLNEFLSHTAMKSGMEPDSWKDKNTEIYKFQADIFNQSIL